MPRIVYTALSGARPGAIILMHDHGGNRSDTVAALPRIIAAIDVTAIGWSPSPDEWPTTHPR